MHDAEPLELMVPMIREAEGADRRDRESRSVRVGVGIAAVAAGVKHASAGWFHFPSSPAGVTRGSIHSREDGLPPQARSSPAMTRNWIGSTEPRFRSLRADSDPLGLLVRARAKPARPEALERRTMVAHAALSGSCLQLLSSVDRSCLFRACNFGPGAHKFGCSREAAR